MSAIRPTTKKELWVITDVEGNLMAFGSGGKTSYLSEGAAIKALEGSIRISNSVDGTDYTTNDFTVTRLDVPLSPF